MKPTPSARLPWSRLLHPRIAVAAMLVSTLLAGLAMQHSVDRLEAAAQARAHLERQSASLHERFQATAPTSQAPAMQQLRADHDEAIASAAALGRWTVWASLAWMLGLGAASAWTLRRVKQPAVSADTQPHSSAAPSAAADAATPSQVPMPAPEPAPILSRPDWADLADIAREMRAVSALIGSDTTEPAEPTLAPALATSATTPMAPVGEPQPAPAPSRTHRVITLLDDDTAPNAEAMQAARWSFPASSAHGLRLAA